MTGFQDRMVFAVNRAGGVARLARAAGVSESVIRKWRSGKSEPNRSSLVKIADAGRVSVQWLATGEGEPGGIEAPGQASTHRQPTADRRSFVDVVHELESAIEEVGHAPTPLMREGLTTAMYSHGLTRSGAVTLLQFLKACKEQSPRY